MGVEKARNKLETKQGDERRSHYHGTENTARRNQQDAGEFTFFPFQVHLQCPLHRFIYKTSCIQCPLALQLTDKAENQERLFAWRKKMKQLPETDNRLLLFFNAEDLVV